MDDFDDSNEPKPPVVHPGNDVLIRDEHHAAFVRLIAKEVGFHDHHRIRPGEEFLLNVPRNCKSVPMGYALKPGDVAIESPAKKCMWLLPKWTALATDEARAEVAAAPQRAQDKFAEAAVISSGSTGNKKRRSFIDAMRAGTAPLPKAAQAAVDVSGGPAAKKKMADLKEQAAQADVPSLEQVQSFLKGK